MSASVPNLHVSSRSEVRGSARVLILSRKNPVHSGRFATKLDVTFDPASDRYPTGSIQIKTDLTDSAVATFSATSIELINSFGKHTPMVFLTGRCKVRLQEQAQLPEGCKYWLMIASNGGPDKTGTPDIVAFIITDRTGTRVAYGAGPVETGDINVFTTGG